MMILVASATPFHEAIAAVVTGPDHDENRRLAALADRDVEQAFGRDVELVSFVQGEIRQSIEDKQAAGFSMSSTDFQRTVVDYEIFKARTFLASGVFPKRYFGFVDGKWDTAAREAELKDVIHRAVLIANAQGAAITDLEIAVTFLAEGGALLLKDAHAPIDHIHPVLGIGLDDIASGLAALPALAAALDAEFSTTLLTTVMPSADGPRLGHLYSLREAILGTVLMYVYERNLAKAKLAASKRQPLEGRPLDERFILTSLVYNSGLLFAEERITALRTLGTRGYLEIVTSENLGSRAMLPLGNRTLLLDSGYPTQPTSWNAVYHVLQRYGAFVALRRFTDAFAADGSLSSTVH